MAEYRVLRGHIGDREYMPGDTREAAPHEVAHLVASGCLEDGASLETKVETVPENKAKAKK